MPDRLSSVSFRVATLEDFVTGRTPHENDAMAYSCVERLADVFGLAIRDGHSNFGAEVAGVVPQYLIMLYSPDRPLGCGTDYISFVWPSSSSQSVYDIEIKGLVDRVVANWRIENPARSAQLPRLTE